MKYFFILLFTAFFSCNLINNDSINEIDSDELTEFLQINDAILVDVRSCLLYTSPSPRDRG